MISDPFLNSSLFTVRSENDPENQFSSKIFGNNTLKVGAVIEVYEPEDKNNVSKASAEYDVMVIEQDKSNGINYSIYRNCLALDSFGSVADYFQVKYRKPKDSKKVRSNTKLKDQQGSIVLILCLDGNAEKAVIVGALAHPNRKKTLNKDSGHALEGEFNGIKYTIDKSGGLTITFKGATDGDGKPISAKEGGSQIKIEKDGSVELNDAPLSEYDKAGNLKTNKASSAVSGEYEKVRIDKTAQSISQSARKDISATSGANVNISAKADVNMKMNNLIAQAEGSVKYKSAGEFGVSTDSAFNLKAASGQVTLDDSLMIKSNNVNINAQTVSLGAGASPAVTMNTIFQGVGFAGVPVFSHSIGPYSSVVMIAP
jgi:hypothetical protein